VPLLGATNRLLGVLTSYAPKDDAFSDAHRYAFERIASLLSARIESLAEGSNVVQFPSTDRT
jgi:hypothetical protein